MLIQGVQMEQTGAVVTVVFEGREVSHETMQETVLACAESVRYEGARHFALDLSNVQYMASACIGALVGFMREVEHVRGRIGLAGCSEDVTFLFKVTQLDRVFTIYDDVDDAVACLERE